MSRIEKAVYCLVFVATCLLLVAVCIYVDATGRRIKKLETNLQQTQDNWMILWTAADETFRAKELNACHCGKKVAAAPPSCPRSKFCPCTPPCQCSECRCGGALPAPETPLITAQVHDGQAFIAWIDGNGQRQVRTMTEEEFCQLNAKGKCR